MARVAAQPPGLRPPPDDLPRGPGDVDPGIDGSGLIDGKLGALLNRRVANEKRIGSPWGMRTA